MDTAGNSPLMEVRQLKKFFPLRTGLLAAGTSNREGRHLKALDGVDLAIRPGQVMGIAGGSGAGKTTLGLTMLRLYEPASGAILFDGKEITRVPNRDLKPFRRQAQIIFQDPYGSLNPRFTVARAVVEPLIVHGIGNKNERLDQVKHALEVVELVPPERFLDRFPHELSGGQRQRLCIARAMVLGARFLVADEPVSMLDVSIRAEILTLLTSLVHDFHLGVLFVSHDLASMRYVCDTIGIMYRGRIVESAPPDTLIGRPLHPYTRALVAAVPAMDVGAGRARVVIKAELKSTAELPGGCRFRLQCPRAGALCGDAEPELKEAEPGHAVACHLPWSDHREGTRTR